MRVRGDSADGRAGRQRAPRRRALPRAAPRARAHAGHRQDAAGYACIFLHFTGIISLLNPFSQYLIC